MFEHWRVRPDFVLPQTIGHGKGGMEVTGCFAAVVDHVDERDAKGL